MEWLIGKWKRLHEEAGKETVESWDKLSHSEYAGIGYTVQNGNTISQENMIITETNGKWTLSVRTMEDEHPTFFTLSELKANGFTFVNHDIDFPKSIAYWVEDQILKARLIGEDLEIPYEFERIK